MIRLKLLQRLGRLERETDPQYDPRWDTLCRGDLPANDVEALKGACEFTQCGEALFAAFSPLDAAARERIGTQVMALSARSRASRLPSAASISKVRRVMAFALAAVLGAAGAAALIRGLPSAEQPAPVARCEPSAASLPFYMLEVRGGDVSGAVRSASPASEPIAVESTTLGPGAWAALVLRPDRAAEAPVWLASCAVRGGVATPWAAPWQGSEQGSYHVEGSREALFPEEPAGEVTLLLAIGSAVPPPSCDELAAGKGGAQVLTHRVLLR